MHDTVKNLLKINEKVKVKLSTVRNSNKIPKIIAVSKTFKMQHIYPLIDHGHVDFGENKVQEAQEKWTEIKEKNKNIKLHLIGRLQTNKVKIAVKLFDYIHSLDSKKLADKISKYQKEQNLKKKMFIQVNIGDEDQKSGIQKEELPDFYNYCKNLELDVLGLMCIPPIDDDPVYHFNKLQVLANENKIDELSIGMSDEYEKALKFNPSYIRLGTILFGKRL